MHTREGKRDTAAPYGITTINSIFLEAYHSITNINVVTAQLARTDDRSKQNSRAMYHCIKGSIYGNFKIIIFSQLNTGKIHEDSIQLFLDLTKHTSTTSIQLAVLAFNNIVHCDPSVFKFNIPIMNTKLSHLFVLATTCNRTLTEQENIQHTLAAYKLIQQPKTWSQWVTTQMDNFDDGKLKNCQNLMNTTAIKYIKISKKYGFDAFLATLYDDIVSTVSFVKRKRKPNEKKDENKKINNGNDKEVNKKQTPLKHFPFLKHIQKKTMLLTKLVTPKLGMSTFAIFVTHPINMATTVIYGQQKSVVSTNNG